MLRYGCTRLEVSSGQSLEGIVPAELISSFQIGVQSVYEDVARDTNRGHTVKATCEAFQLSKDSGFKVVSHMMVGSVSCRFRLAQTDTLYSTARLA